MANQNTAAKRKSEVIYLSGTSEALEPHWDVMKVVFQHDDGGQTRTRDSVVIARNLSGKIIRRTDDLLDHWGVVNDKEMLCTFQHYFEERDRLRLEKSESNQHSQESR